MRIIAGKHRSRKILTLTGQTTRPSSDRLKESLFNMIGQRCDLQQWLDVFAGSGAIGLEALSRGASFVVFNDSQPLACDMIKTNISTLGEQQQSVVLNLDAIILDQYLSKQSWMFDVVYLDPPYQYPIKPIVELIMQASYVKPQALIIIERAKDESLEYLSDYNIMKHKQIGHSQFVILKRS